MKIGFVGLGSMGRNMALNLQDEGVEVVGWNRSEDRRELARSEGLNPVVDSLKEMVERFAGHERKVIFLMVSAGEAVDKVLFDDNGLAGLLDEGSIVIDGANSFYKDSKRRAERLAASGIDFLDAGISGGVAKAREGLSIMVGGDQEVFHQVEEVFSALAQQDGYGYFGNSGAGHFVKMVHNGIEYGMMQAIAEGMNIIKQSEYNSTDLQQLTKVWSNGSVIESNLVKFLNLALSKDQYLSSTQPEIGSLGTGKWTLEQALELGVPAPAIAAAIFARYSSRGQDEFLLKVVQAMRAEFGNHTSEERPQ